MLSQKFDLYRSEWLELVFDDRNKAYGAYDLRKHYDNTLLKALGFTTLGFVTLMLAYGFFLTRKPFERVTPVTLDPTIVAPPVSKIKPPVIPPKQKVDPPKVNTVKFPPPVVVVDELAKNPPTIDEIKTAVVGQENVKGIEGPPPIEPLTSGTAAIIEDNDVKPFGTIEVNPQFPGGEAAWSKFLQKNLRYPSQAVEEGISGKVYVSFVVEKDGHLSDITLIRGPGHGLDEEAIRVLKLVPPWKPGIQNGRPVRVRYNMPFNFQIPPSD